MAMILVGLALRPVQFRPWRQLVESFEIAGSQGARDDPVLVEPTAQVDEPAPAAAKRAPFGGKPRAFLAALGTPNPEFCNVTHR